MIQIAGFQVGATGQQPIHHSRISRIVQRRFAIAAALMHDRRIALISGLQPIQPALLSRRVNRDLGAALDEPLRRFRRSHFQKMKVARPPLRFGLDIGAVFEQDIDEIFMLFGDDERGRAEIKMGVINSRLQLRMRRQEFVEPRRVLGVYQLFELFQGVAEIVILQLDSEPQLAPALGAVFAGDDRLRLAQGQRERGCLGAPAVFDLRQMLMDAVDSVGVAGLETAFKCLRGADNVFEIGR